MGGGLSQERDRRDGTAEVGQQGWEPSAFRAGWRRRDRNYQPSVLAGVGRMGTISLPWWLAQEGWKPSAFSGGAGGLDWFADSKPEAGG